MGAGLLSAVVDNDFGEPGEKLNQIPRTRNISFEYLCFRNIMPVFLIPLADSRDGKRGAFQTDLPDTHVDSKRTL